MEIDVFIQEMKSLEIFYEKELSVEQSKDWYAELKEYSIEKIRQAIRETKKTCKFMPKLCEFLETIQNIKVEQKEKEKVECKKCNGTGTLIYIKKVLNGTKLMEYPYGCQCDCGNATNLDLITIDQLKAQGYEEKYYDKDKKIFWRLEKDVWK